MAKDPRGEQYAMTVEETRQCVALTDALLKTVHGYSRVVIEVAVINMLGSIYIADRGHENRQEIATDMVAFVDLVAQSVEQILTNPEAILTRKQMKDAGFIPQSN